MGAVTFDDVCIEPLMRISTPGGDVMHALKSTDACFSAFGEAYFSWAAPNAVKAWKLHRCMTLNLVVPVGRVLFVFHLPGHGFRMEEIGDANYARITVPPGIWFGFQGRDMAPSLVLNIANIAHDPDEVERKAVSEIAFDWHISSIESRPLISGVLTR